MNRTYDNKRPERLLNHQFMFPNLPFAVFNQTVSESVGLHWHEFYEMFLIVAGEGEHVLNGRSYPLRKGGASIVTPSDFHEVVPAPGNRLELFNIIFSEEMIQKELFHLVFRDLRDRVYLFEAAEFDCILPEFSLIWQESQSFEPGQFFVIKATLERILVKLVRASRQSLQEIGRPGDYETTIHKALLYIHHHFREPLSLARIAAHVQLSPSYFSECFSRSVGMSFQHYLQNLRLQFAKSLLGASELSVTEICYASGFNTLTYFIKAFAQKFGESPGYYRRQRK